MRPRQSTRRARGLGSLHCCPTPAVPWVARRGFCGHAQQWCSPCSWKTTSTSLWTLKTSAFHPPCHPARGCWRPWRPFTALPPTTGPGTVKAGSRMASMSSSEQKCGRGGGKARKRGTAAPPGLGADPKAAGAPLHAPTRGPPSPQAPTPGPGHAPAPAPTPAPDPGAGAGLAPQEAAHGPGHGPGLSPTPQEGGVGRDPGAPPRLLRLVWVLTQRLLYLTRGSGRRTKAIRCW